MDAYASFLPAILGGVLIGLSSWLLLASLGRIAGLSGIASKAIFSKPSGENGSWRWMFLLGLVGGGAVFSNWLHVPIPAAQPTWLLIVGGLMVGFGTVLGNGCTSGHGICGLARKSKRSLVATGTFMFAGFATVYVARLIGYPLI